MEPRTPLAASASSSARPSSARRRPIVPLPSSQPPYEPEPEPEPQGDPPPPQPATGDAAARPRGRRMRATPGAALPSVGVHPQAFTFASPPQSLAPEREPSAVAAAG